MDVSAMSRGSVQIIFGPMFSGKTTGLRTSRGAEPRPLRAAADYNFCATDAGLCSLCRASASGEALLDCQAEVFADQVRQGQPLQCARRVHARQVWQLPWSLTRLSCCRQVSAATACSSLADLEAEAAKFDIIGIDEGQFVRSVATGAGLR